MGQIFEECEAHDRFLWIPQPFQLLVQDHAVSNGLDIRRGGVGRSIVGQGDGSSFKEVLA